MAEVGERGSALNESPDGLDLVASRRRIAAVSVEVNQLRADLERLHSGYRALERSKFARLRALSVMLRSLAGFGSPSHIFPLVRDETSAISAALQLLPPQAPIVYADVAEAFSHRVANVLPVHDPMVTVVIPAFEQTDVTMRCLKSIADTWPETLTVEVVVVDDASRDETTAALAQIPGITVIRNASNLGFLHSCNRALAIARGKYVALLNNDTVVHDAWLDHLVTTAEADSRIGAVGSKLVYPDGSLQEAGSILWRDGSGWNVGRAGNANDPAFNFVREVDYCSAASLLVRSDVLRAIGGGFDARYAPAYYEDADLCMAIRNAGFKVVYQPRSIVTHFEGLSSGTTLDAGVKAFQARNAPRFEEKWREVLRSDHYENGAENVYRAARRHYRKPSVLIIDANLPMPDRDAGSLRLWRIIEHLVRAGFRVVFHPRSYASVQPYTAELQDLGVEVLHRANAVESPEQRLNALFPTIDVAWVCRPDVGEQYIAWLRQFPNVKIVYDTVDLHFVRLRRKAEVEGRPHDLAWEAMREIELGLSQISDATITVTPDERSALTELGVSPVYVVPTIHEPKGPRPRSFEITRDLLFIGGYAHPPNIDAVEWLVDTVMPLVWRVHPEMKVTLLGSDPPPQIRAMASDCVSVPGYVADVDPYFDGHRIFVAPLRYGAGHKGKIGHALAHALPIVTTPVGAEGFDLEDGTNALIAADAAAFAKAVLRLYDDAELWSRLSAHADAALAPFSRAAAGAALDAIFADLEAGKRSRHFA